MENDVILKVEHLKQYFKMGRSVLKAVDDVSFEVKRGEVFGIVGESGCGKTTTGRSIIKLYDITGGDVWFKGQHISTGETDMRRRISQAKKAGRTEEAARLSAELKKNLSEVDAVKKQKIMTKMQMIFQDPVASLNPRMTVREIIAEGLTIRGVRDKKVIDEAVQRSLEMVGLVSEHAERYPHEFSGGQRQRIGIARAIVLEPELIIADEPISALDVSIQAQVINLLNDLRRQMQLTLIFIAHDLSVVKYFSDRIAVMYYGKIVELAGSEELFKHPLHPYTKALLSAIPLPDPYYEKQRRRILYVPARDHDYGTEVPQLREVSPGHFVSCSTAEFDAYRAILEA
ncbi:MAG: ATP-binding cassette domain-containing protein [Papillibacter sp.]|nr:ATP-binding cassette domain-containing protein [Papillibacter sp.]